MVKPLCDDPLRTKERRFVRARARGMSARAAAMLAGYSSGHAYLLQRRLSAEVAQERAKLAGMNGGHVPATFSPRDARRLARRELARIVDTWRPHHAAWAEQTIRELARQIPAATARELLISYGNERMKLRQAGGDGARLGQLVHYAGRLLDEIAAYRGLPAAAEGFSPAQKSSSENNTLSRAHAHEGRANGDAPPACCPTHPSQPRGACQLCGLDPVRRWREQDARPVRRSAPDSSDVFIEPPLPPWSGR